MQAVQSKLLKYLPHYLRKRFEKKILIIESDDWGLERGVNYESIEWAKRKFGEESFTRWTLDALETREDLAMLFNVLRSHKDESGNHQVITANFITHNIDYSSKESLKFIPISKGFNSLENIHESYCEGVKDGLIFPQLHGYSHYNLSALREYSLTEEASEALKNKYLTCRSTIRGNLAFLQGELSDENSDNSMIKEAADEFERCFGFRSMTIIPPTFVLDKSVLKYFKDSGVKLVQSSNRIQQSDKRRYNVPFFRKRAGLIWSIRNARLDPIEGYNFYHQQCIDSMEKAFANKLPAIIDFHRVNFSGKFNPTYRERTLGELDSLVGKVLKKWPDVKFIHSQKLYELIWRQETR